MKTADFQAELARLRSTPCVDYPGVAQAKLRILRLLHAQFRRDTAAPDSSRVTQFQAYVAERGESLRRHALHDAIDQHMRSIDGHRYWGWPMWPEELRDPAHPGVHAFEQSHAESVEFHAWLQWLADEQLGEAQSLGRQLGMPIGLYGDYAVGVNPSGSETWSDQALYRKGAGVGAPPDALALKGQDWGIPPQDPNVLMAEQYRPFRNLISANMRHFGALRLDHVMALFRQWWVPVGLGSTEGGYVHYPLDDLMSVLALESERHGCLVVGEDLGTVPPEMSHAMDDRAVYSYRVLLFEKRPDGSFMAPGEYPRRAIATVTTHDLPTLRGYWSGGDIDLRQRLSLYPNEETRQHVADERVRDRHALLAALEANGLKPAAASAAADGYTDALVARDPCVPRAHRICVGGPAGRRPHRHAGPGQRARDQRRTRQLAAQDGLPDRRNLRPRLRSHAAARRQFRARCRASGLIPSSRCCTRSNADSLFNEYVCTPLQVVLLGDYDPRVG